MAKQYIDYHYRGLVERSSDRLKSLTAGTPGTARRHRMAMCVIPGWPWPSAVRKRPSAALPGRVGGQRDVNAVQIPPGAQTRRPFNSAPTRLN